VAAAWYACVDLARQHTGKVGHSTLSLRQALKLSELEPTRAPAKQKMNIDASGKNLTTTQCEATVSATSVTLQFDGGDMSATISAEKPFSSLEPLRPIRFRDAALSWKDSSQPLSPFYTPWFSFLSFCSRLNFLNHPDSSAVLCADNICFCFVYPGRASGCLWHWQPDSEGYTGSSTPSILRVTRDVFHPED
jgi:hypothetical protein